MFVLHGVLEIDLSTTLKSIWTHIHALADLVLTACMWCKSSFLVHDHLTSNMVCNHESQQSFTCIFEKKKEINLTTFIVDTKEFGYSDISQLEEGN